MPQSLLMEAPAPAIAFKILPAISIDAVVLILTTVTSALTFPADFDCRAHARVDVLRDLETA